jgi:hypothetical protein
MFISGTNQRVAFPQLGTAAADDREIAHQRRDAADCGVIAKLSGLSWAKNLLTWRVLTLRSCVGIAVNDFAS